MVKKLSASLLILLALIISPGILQAQQAAAQDAAGELNATTSAGAAAAELPEPPKPPVEKRIFGVLPNYRTVDGSIPFAPLTSRQKLGIAAKDSFDWPIYITTAAFATIYQAQDQTPSFGKGLSGYTKRYTAALGDLAIGNMMTEGVFPVLLHEDPRYFREGTGTTGSRLKSALKQILVTRTDSGGHRFNTSEWLGNGVGVGISNLYYSDSRTFSANIQRFGMQIGSDALSNVLKEFWPDIKHGLFDRHRE